MRGIAILAATAALVTLAGCDRLRGGGAAANNANASANVAAGNQAAAQRADGAGAKPSDGGDAAPAAGAGGGAVPLDRAFLVGRWTDDGDCGPDATTVITFTQDLRFIAANGGTGLWNLDGDELTMTGRDTATVRIIPVDRDTMTVVNADGSLGRSTRC